VAEEVPRNELAIDNGRRAVPRQAQPAKLENAVVAEKIFACAIRETVAPRNEQHVGIAAQANIFSATTAFSNSGRLSLTGNGAATVINGQLVSGTSPHDGT